MMNITVTTPTGKIGSVVTKKLLKEKVSLTLVARYPEKVKYAVDQGAKVIQGSSDDPEVLKHATQNADVLFVLTPPDMSVTDIKGHYRRFAAAAAEAVKENKIPYVVHLSSIGAELESGNGPVAGLHVNEEILREACPNIVQLRAGYFMENTLGQLQNIVSSGSLFTTFPQDTKLSMIATEDIGHKAAELLIKADWNGEKIVELVGPEEISYEDVARILSEVLGKELKHVTIPDEQFIQAMTSMGASRELAEGLAEMSHALASRKMAPKNPEKGKITYENFAKNVFKPAFEAIALTKTK
jgi:uncharacterized protein YbjT (DUF2867 family)